MKSSVLNALTIDVEDWYHPELVRGCLGSWAVEDRVEISMRPLLALLDRHGVKATCFFLGEIAEKHPDLVRRLHGEGHEIACHGMSHVPLWALDAKAFERDLESFLALLARIVPGIAIRGHRAPTFSLSAKTQWALPILQAHGFRYDASLFPARVPGNSLYGVARAPRFPYRVSLEDLMKEDASSGLVEFPNAVLSVGGLPLPVGGGFYMRAMPRWLLSAALEQMNRTGPFSLYVHPWELDPSTPRVPLGIKNGLITYHGIDSALEKLERLLSEFSFTRVDRVIAQQFPGV